MSLLKVHKVEGLPYSSSTLGCYVHLNNTLHDIITPISPSHTIPLPTKGKINLFLKAMTEENPLLASFAFELETFSSHSSVFPLNSEPLIPPSTIQLSVSSPKSFSLSPAPEKLASPESDWQKLKLQFKMQSFSLEELNSELQLSKQQLNNEINVRQNLENKLKMTVKEYTEFVSMAQDREQSMLQLLQHKDVEIAANINQSLKLKGCLERLLEEKKQIEEKLNCFKTLVANDETELLKQQVHQLKTQLAQEVKRRQELQKMLLKIGKEWKDTEHQEKLAFEHKLEKAEQDYRNANTLVLDLQGQVKMQHDAQDRSRNEIESLKQELKRVKNKKLKNDSDIVELTTKLRDTRSKCVQTEDSLIRCKAEIRNLFESKEKISGVVVCKDKQIVELQKKLFSLNEDLKESKAEVESLNRKLQQEKIYNDQLNEQVIQERITAEKWRIETIGPELDELIDESFKAVAIENRIVKKTEKYFYEGIEIQIRKKCEFGAEVKVVNSELEFMILKEFLLKFRSLKGEILRVGKECENEGVVERGKKICPEKGGREIKGKGIKFASRSLVKLPFKERNARIGSISTERKKVFK